MTLENELKEVISNCRAIVKCNYSVIKSKQRAEKKRSKEVKGGGSQVTLEKIAQNMADVLENLKNYLQLTKKKTINKPATKQAAVAQSNATAAKSRKNNQLRSSSDKRLAIIPVNEKSGQENMLAPLRPETAKKLKLAQKKKSTKHRNGLKKQPIVDSKSRENDCKVHSEDSARTAP